MEKIPLIDLAGDSFAGKPAPHCLFNRWRTGAWLAASLLLIPLCAQAQYTNWSRFAGQDSGMGTADSGQDGQSRFYAPEFIATDAHGRFYVTDSQAGTIRQITPDNLPNVPPSQTVTTLAGWANNPGERDGQGLRAQFDQPMGIVARSDGTLWVADFGGQTIRQFSADNMVTTYAGKAGVAGHADGDPLAARFSGPAGLAFDGVNIYVADSTNCTIRKISDVGQVSTIAGQPNVHGHANGQGTAATFSNPFGVAYDPWSGNLYVADSGNSLIRQISPTGMVTTIAGVLGTTDSVDGPPGQAHFSDPRGIVADGLGNIYVSEYNNTTIREIDSSGNVTSLPPSIWNSEPPGYPRAFNHPTGLLINFSGSLYVADTGNHTVRQVTSEPPGAPPAEGTVLEYAGLPGIPGGFQNGFSNTALFDVPRGIVTDAAGNVYVTDSVNHQIRKITPGGVVSTLAGSQVPTHPGANGQPVEQDGLGTAAQFVEPYGLAIDTAGNLYVSDDATGSIRKITPAGQVTTPVSKKFSEPQALALDTAGNIYVTDTGRDVIAKVTPKGVVTTIAGVSGVAGTTDGPEKSAHFNQPAGIAVDAAGEIFVADTNNHTIRKISTTGQVSTLAGWVDRLGSDDGAGPIAQFAYPRGLALDASGNILVADSANDEIRRVTPSTGEVVTLGGSPGSGANWPGIYNLAEFSLPYAVAVDPSGLIYVAESDSNVISVGTTGPRLTVTVNTDDLAVNGQAIPGSDTGIPLPMGSLINFGNVPLGETGQITVVITDTGMTEFDNLAVSLDGGPNTTDFIVSPLLFYGSTGYTSIAPGASVTSLYFTITFQPHAAVTSSANVHITSTDGGIDSYSFSLTGSSTP